MLEQTWVRKKQPGDGTFYIVSGFANYNGGVRFYDTFKHHIDRGGKCIAYFGGSTSQRLTSQQVVEELLGIGCEVYIINRKRLLHAKCYGCSSADGDALVISSGNFTGPGMSQNIEASLLVDGDDVRNMSFSWHDLESNLQKQKWDISKPSLVKKNAPVWKLLYDETSREIKLDSEQEMTMLITLGHSDTRRILANPGETAGLGTQYFWLSKDSYDFFPALTIRNKRGYKATFSTLINMNYIDLGIKDPECRVTFEAENNVDFRLGTGKLRYTKMAKPGDLAAITRLTEYDYELRVIKIEDDNYTHLIPYANTFIGGRDKKIGYIPNADFNRIIR